MDFRVEKVLLDYQGQADALAMIVEYRQLPLGQDCTGSEDYTPTGTLTSRSRRAKDEQESLCLLQYMAKGKSKGTRSHAKLSIRRH